MKVLVACEYSGVVRDAFLKRGHDAIRCDILLSVSGARWFYHPEDKHLDYNDRRPHPKHPNRRQLQDEALEFVKLLFNAPIKKIALENPISVISTKIRKPDQIIQPYEFGHPTTKTTCLWLKNLDKLNPTNIVEPEWVYTKNRRWSKFYYDTYKLPNNEKAKARSRTFSGIAEAMADQWG